MAKSKKSAKKRAKEKAWKEVSLFVRLEFADHNGMCTCVTCGHVAHYTQGMHAGHFVPQAQGDAARFEIDNIHVQCFRCNINLGSNGAEYTPFMVNKYGQERVDEIRQLAGKVVKYSESDYNDMISKYKALISELDKG